MPVVINEVEILDAPPPPVPASTSAPVRNTEPAHEQLRRLTRDLDGRRRRLIAD